MKYLFCNDSHENNIKHQTDSNSKTIKVCTGLSMNYYFHTNLNYRMYKDKRPRFDLKPITQYCKGMLLWDYEQYINLSTPLRIL